MKKQTADKICRYSEILDYHNVEAGANVEDPTQAPQ